MVWVTILGRVFYLGMQPSQLGQLSLASLRVASRYIEYQL